MKDNLEKQTEAHFSVWTHTHTHTHKHTLSHTHSCTHSHTHTVTHSHSQHTHTHTLIHSHIHTHTHSQTHTHTHIHTLKHTHTHSHTHTLTHSHIRLTTRAQGSASPTAPPILRSCSLLLRGHHWRESRTGLPAALPGASASLPWGFLEASQPQEVLPAWCPH